MGIQQKPTAELATVRPATVVETGFEMQGVKEVRDERALFEMWFERCRMPKLNSPFGLSSTSNYRYRNPIVEYMWEGWSMRAIFISLLPKNTKFDERALFEFWFDRCRKPKIKSPFGLNRTPSGRYRTQIVKYMWEGWEMRTIFIIKP